MPWLSEPSIEIAPMSCSTSSAAMVCRRDAALGECHVLRDRRIEVMAHHRHVEVFVERVDGVRDWSDWSRTAGSCISPATRMMSGRVAAAGALGVIHVDGAAADRVQRILDETGLRSAYRCGSGPGSRARRRPAGRCRSPPASSPNPRGSSGPCTPVSICSTSGGGLCELPRPRKPKFIGQASAACSIFPVLKGPPESIPTVIGPSEPPIIVVIPLPMACSHRPALSKCTCTSMAPGVAISPSQSRTVVAGADDQARIDAVHDRRIAGLADADDAAVPDAEIAFDDPEHGIDERRRCRAGNPARPRRW